VEAALRDLFKWLGRLTTRSLAPLTMAVTLHLGAVGSAVAVEPGSTGMPSAAELQSYVGSAAFEVELAARLGASYHLETSDAVIGKISVPGPSPPPPSPPAPPHSPPADPPLPQLPSSPAAEGPPDPARNNAGLVAGLVVGVVLVVGGLALAFVLLRRRSADSTQPADGTKPKRSTHVRLSLVLGDVRLSMFTRGRGSTKLASPGAAAKTAESKGPSLVKEQGHV